MVKIYLFLVLLLFPIVLFAQKEWRDVRKGNKLYEEEKYVEAEVGYQSYGVGQRHKRK